MGSLKYAQFAIFLALLLYPVFANASPMEIIGEDVRAYDNGLIFETKLSVPSGRQTGELFITITNTKNQNKYLDVRPLYPYDNLVSMEVLNVNKIKLIPYQDCKTKTILVTTLNSTHPEATNEEITTCDTLNNQVIEPGWDLISLNLVNLGEKDKKKPKIGGVTIPKNSNLTIKVTYENKLGLNWKYDIMGYDINGNLLISLDPYVNSTVAQYNGLDWNSTKSTVWARAGGQNITLSYSNNTVSINDKFDRQNNLSGVSGGWVNFNPPAWGSDCQINLTSYNVNLRNTGCSGDIGIDAYLEAPATSWNITVADFDLKLINGTTGTDGLYFGYRSSDAYMPCVLFWNGTYAGHKENRDSANGTVAGNFLNVGLNEWHHYTMIYNRSKGKCIYLIDDVNYGSYTQGASKQPQTARFRLDAVHKGTIAQMDNLVIHNETLHYETNGTFYTNQLKLSTNVSYVNLTFNSNVGSNTWVYYYGSSNGIDWTNLTDIGGLFNLGNKDSFFIKLELGTNNVSETPVVYSLSAGLTENYSKDPTLVLNSPNNNSLYTNFVVAFNYTPGSVTSRNLTCNLSINSKTNTTGIVANNTPYNITLRFTSPGSYTWKVICNDSLIVESETRTFEISGAGINITLCNGSVGSTKLLFFDFYDENIKTPVNLSYSGTFNIGWEDVYINSNFSVYATNFSLCVWPDPTGSDVIINEEGLVNGPGYYYETVYVNKVSYNNYFYNRSIYITPENASITTLTIKTINGETEKGVYVYVMKYDPGTNGYIMAESLKTNDVGQAIAHLYLNSYLYKFLVYDADNNLLRTTENNQILATTLTIITSGGMTGMEKLIDNNNLVYSFTWDNSTKIISLSWTAQKSMTVCMRTERIGGFSKTVLNDTCSTGIVGYITQYVDIGNFTYVSTAYTTGSVNPLKVLEVNNFKPGLKWGMMGLFAGILLIIFLGMAGSGNPVVAVMMALGGLIIMVLVGILQMPIIYLAAIGLIGVFIMVRAKA